MDFSEAITRNAFDVFVCTRIKDGKKRTLRKTRNSYKGSVIRSKPIEHLEEYEPYRYPDQNIRIFDSWGDRK